MSHQLFGLTNFHLIEHFCFITSSFISMMTNYLKPVAAVLLPNISGFVNGYLARRETRSGEITWYSTLNKSSLNPPKWAFGPIWTGLYCSMGYASYMVWRDGNGFAGDAAIPLTWYGIQLVLSNAWIPIFFKYKRLGLSFAVITGLWGCIAATVVTFHRVNPTAAYMLLPYLSWVSLASYLNFYCWWYNKDKRF